MLENGTKVRVYCANITKVQVDVIVNAANGHLDHMGGVAYAIAKAAGPEFQKESNHLVSEKGEIPVSDVAVTSAGKLTYQHVIHAVGPVWSGPSNRDETEFLLEKTFFNVFQCADDLNMKSLAVPIISSG